MISLKENSRYLSTKDKHIKHIKEQVCAHIDIYKAITSIIPVIKRTKLIVRRNELIRVNIEKNFNLSWQATAAYFNGLLEDNVVISRGTYYLGVKELLPQFLSFNLFEKSLNYLESHIEEILAIEFKPPYIGVYRKYIKYMENLSDLHPILFNKILSYDEFRDKGLNDEWNPYKLTSKLNVKSCPYCNRLYTITVSGKSNKLTRPQLDHFLPQHKYKLFQLSFHNLIPSCTVCNMDIKGSAEISLYNHFSPYEENTNHELMYIDYIPKSYEASIGLSEKIQVKIKYAGDPVNLILKNKVEGNINLFKLNEVYSKHGDQVAEILRKKHLSSDKYIECIQNTFKNFKLTKEEAYKISFGNFYKEKDFIKRPFSKMTKDIAGSVKKNIKRSGQ